MHPSLDQSFVPEFYVAWVIFHEMLHEAYGVEEVNGRRHVHPPEFVALEQTYPNYERARAWEKRHLSRLLRYRHRFGDGLPRSVAAITNLGEPVHTAVWSPIPRCVAKCLIFLATVGQVRPLQKKHWVRRRLNIIAFSVLGTVGCTNEVSSPVDPAFESSIVEPELPLEQPLRCDPGTTPAAQPVKRLSNVQYRNSIRQLFADQLFDADVAAAMSAHADRLPRDRDTGQTFAAMDQRLTEGHVDVHFNLADSLASAVVSSPERREALAGACANGSPISEACVESFVRSFGRRVFRRPLDEIEVQNLVELRELSTEPQPLLGDVVFSFLMAPQFLYVLEDRGEAIEGAPNILRLTPWEVASRLTFTFWGSPPDEAVLDAVEAGAFDSEDGYEEQVRLVLQDPRADSFVRSFFDQWFEIPDAVDFPDDPIFAAVAEGVEVDSSLYLEMRNEAHALIEEMVWNETRSYRDLLTSSEVRTSSPRLAELYQVEPWDGVSPPPEASASSPRPGLLTRSAVILATGTTNPILRGAFVRKEILCDELEVPADLPSEAFQFPPQQPDQSTREVVEAKTGVEGCRNCHALLNPLGYMLELFDGLGRYRTSERVLDDSGNVIATVPIDSEVVPQLSYGDPASLSTPEELMASIAEHPKTSACFARHAFRYAFRQEEDLRRDGCSMSVVRDAVEGGSILDAFVALATDRSFKERVIQ